METVGTVNRAMKAFNDPEVLAKQNRGAGSEATRINGQKMRQHYDERRRRMSYTGELEEDVAAEAASEAGCEAGESVALSLSGLVIGTVGGWGGMIHVGGGGRLDVGSLVIVRGLVVVGAGGIGMLLVVVIGRIDVGGVARGGRGRGGWSVCLWEGRNENERR